MSLQPGEKIGGRYEIIKSDPFPLGKGGFAETYLAKDTHKHDKLCVVKLLKPQNDSNSQEAERFFKMESEALHNLEHNQIPKHFAYIEKNQDEPNSYIVQEYIEGCDLRQEIQDKQPLDEEYVIDLFENILEILNFVHQKGFIHLDIKPSNLMRRKQDRKIVLIDFGAAKNIEKLKGSLSGQFKWSNCVGTEGYKAPEQSEGNPNKRSDIYTVGINGIQALTGLDPSKGEIKIEQNKKFSWPSSVSLVSQKLLNFIDKMVCYQHGDRYQSADEALQALQIIKEADDSVKQISEKLYNSLKKGEYCYVIDLPNDRSTLLGLTKLMLEADGIRCAAIDLKTLYNSNENTWDYNLAQKLIASVGSTLNLNLWWYNNKDELQLNRLIKFIEKEILTQNVQIVIFYYNINIFSSNKDFSYREITFKLIDYCYEKRKQDERYKRLTFAILEVTNESLELLIKKKAYDRIAHQISINEFTSPETPTQPKYQVIDYRHKIKDRLIGIGQTLVSNIRNKSRTKLGKTLIFIILLCMIILLILIPYSLQVYTRTKEASNKFNFQQLNSLMLAMQSLQDLQRLSLIENILPNPDSDYNPLLVSQKILDNIYEQNRLDLHQDRVNSVSFSPDGKWIATAADDGTVRLWDSSGKPITYHKAEQGALKTVSFHPGGDLIATGGSDGKIKLWKWESSQSKLILSHELTCPSFNSSDCHQEPITSMSFSPKGDFIATASKDDTVRVWPISSGKQIAKLSHNSDVETVSFNPNGDLIATAGVDGKLRLWKWQENTSKPLWEIPTLHGRIWSLSFSPDGTMIATGGDDGMLCLWDLQGNPKRIDFKSPGSGKTHENANPKNNTFKNGVIAITFSPDGNLITTAGSDKKARLWELKSGKLLGQLDGHESRVLSISFSPDGKKIVTAGEDKTARLWNLSPKQRSPIPTAQTQIENMEIGLYIQSGSAKNNRFLRLVTVEKNGIAKLWNFSDRAKMSWQGNLGEVKLITLSPDQTRIATVDINNVGKIWDISKENRGEFNTDKKEVLSISFSPDGKLIATGGKDGDVKVWNWSSGKMKLDPFKTHQDGVKIVNFSPDQQHIATVSENGYARILAFSEEAISLIDELNDKDSVASISFNPDGKLIATGTTDGSVKLWDSLGKFNRILVNTDWGSIQTLIFSRDGKRIAALGKNGQAGIWEFSSDPIQKQIAKFDGVKLLKMSEQYNQIIATVENDNKVKLWDMRGRQFAEFESKNSGNITTISFTPDGKFIGVAFKNGTVQFWPIEGLKELSKRGCEWLKDYLNTHPNKTNICPPKPPDQNQQSPQQ